MPLILPVCKILDMRFGRQAVSVGWPSGSKRNKVTKSQHEADSGFSLEGQAVIIHRPEIDSVQNDRPGLTRSVLWNWSGIDLLAKGRSMKDCLTKEGMATPWKNLDYYLNNFNRLTFDSLSLIDSIVLYLKKYHHSNGHWNIQNSKWRTFQRHIIDTKEEKME